MKPQPNKIDWTRGELEDEHDHENHYAAFGTDKQGKEYVGTWVECLDEVEIIDIEEA